MEEYGLLDLVKELRGYEPNKEWVDAFETKYKDVIRKWEIDINFRSFSNNNRYNAKNKINILFKSRGRGLYFIRNSRMRGYYILINASKENEEYITLGMGETAMWEWYGTLDYNEELENAPYLEVIKKFEEDGKSFKKIDKTKCWMKLELDKMTDQEFDLIISEYKQIIELYPTIMYEYIKYRGNRDLLKYFVEFKTRGKDQGRIFAMYVWNYIKNNYGVYPKIETPEMDAYEILYEATEKFELGEINEAKDKKLGENVIIYGVPGSGKSYYIKKNILKNAGRERYERVIFHPEYSYYDFVGQKYPNKIGGLTFYPGPFTRVLEKALSNEDKHYYLIIEELNRGNAEAIFGDIFQLLDRKNGESEYRVSNLEIIDYLMDNEEINEKIKDLLQEGVYIPSNMSIYATVNNADQNVFNMDTAFGRRWAQKIRYCDPKKDEIDEEAEIYLNGYIKGTKIKWNDFRTKINKEILENSDVIYNAEDKRMGLFYIDKECLSQEVIEDMDLREKFASKVLKYLWADVFKNCKDKIFNNNIKYLEKIIEEFAKSGQINSILNKEIIEIEEEA